MLRRESAANFRLSEPAAHVAIRHVEAIGHTSSTRLVPPALVSRAAISGDDCLRVLERFGLTQYEKVRGGIWMESGAAFVLVPECESLPIETIVDLLDEARISLEDFLEHLDALSLERIVA
jgi:hypothetical protein